MQILFVHQNFPGQFKFLAPALAVRGHRVVATTMKSPASASWQGVELVGYSPRRGSSASIHPWVTDFETKVIRGEAFFHAARELKSRGFNPDVIVAHHGWGETLFIKEVWPKARLGIYCEFFYHPEGADVGFDPEFPMQEAAVACKMRMKNVNNLLHFDIADAGIAPTHWQASTFPEPFRSKIMVIHDGIDTGRLTPNPGATLTLNGQTTLGHGDEIITFVNRNLEPYRGYHIFMRTLPKILRERPNARVLIVGGNDVSYGAKPQQGNWRDIFINEIRPKIDPSDWSRVHFLGNIPYEHYVSLLQVSSVHVYLTYPFVLSWSLLESMSLGCAIVASDTPPLREAIVHNQTGRLVDFFDIDALADQICDLLRDSKARQTLGKNARKFAMDHYDLQSICLPRQVQWVEQLAS